jgi:hypothetical protein
VKVLEPSTHELGAAQREDEAIPGVAPDVGGEVNRPELKQFGDLTPADFERHPGWIGCHTADYDGAWYDETDEETFRPRCAAGSRRRRRI